MNKKFLLLSSSVIILLLILWFCKLFNTQSFNTQFIHPASMWK